MPARKTSKKTPPKKGPKRAAPKRAAPKRGTKKPLDRAARLASLTSVFQALGARDPKSWARSQVETGTDELARFVLLRALWLKVLEPGRLLARARTDALAGPAVDRLLKKVDLADLDAVVRLSQVHALQDALSVLDDPANTDDGISWGVFRRDKKGAPTARLDELLRDLDETRPT